MKIGLRAKWTSVVTFIILLTAFSSYFLSVRYGVDSIRKELKERGVILAKGLAYNSEYGLFTENKDVLDNLIIGVMKAPDVSYCAIYNNDGQLLVSDGVIQKKNKH